LEKTQHQIEDIKITLLARKAMLVQNQQTLVVSDLHLGKAAHFRKHGIPISKNIHQNDLTTLSELLTLTQAKRLLVIGDLFHSELNGEWALFKEFIEKHAEVKMILVAGNHDRYTKSLIKESMEVYESEYRIDRLLFTHEPLIPNAIEAPFYNICGHIHPAVVLRGNGRQKMKLPCFFFGKKQGILPAFGKFTGTAVLTPTTEDKVYVLANEKVIAVS